MAFEFATRVPEGFVVFCDSTSDAFAPETKTAGFDASSHQLEDVGLAQAGALFDLIKAGAIFPSHADNATR